MYLKSGEKTSCGEFTHIMTDGPVQILPEEMSGW